jgi:hypothetical protein
MGALRRDFQAILPAMFIFFAAGASALPSVAATFLVKDFLPLSALDLATIGFWAALPWMLKAPLGNLVDRQWGWRFAYVAAGALLIAAGDAIMFGLTRNSHLLRDVMSIQSWFLIASIAPPFGFVLQNVVANALTVDVARQIAAKNKYDDNEKIIKLNVTIQICARSALIIGMGAATVFNLIIFSINHGDAERMLNVYGNIYLYSLFVPLISLASMAFYYMLERDGSRIPAFHESAEGHGGPILNRWIIGGPLVCIMVAIFANSIELPMTQELVFACSLTAIVIAMQELLTHLDAGNRRRFVGTAVLAFSLLMVPQIGPGMRWYEIDKLGFDEQFISQLSLITTGITLLSLVMARRFIISLPISVTIILLSAATLLLNLPHLALYLGMHVWTARHTYGIVDAKFIAIIDTAMETPLTQVTLVPLGTWIAVSAPHKLKATFFAVVASFMVLGNAASQLLTKWLYLVFHVSREMKDHSMGDVISNAYYDELGYIIYIVCILSVVLPIGAVCIVQRTRFAVSGWSSAES